MIFRRNKSNLSSTSIGGCVDERINSKAETLYVGAMCFAAACLSFMTLEVGARSPLGQSVSKSATFNAIFRRSYNMKIKIMITDIVVGLITTIMLALGDIYCIPYLYVPWLSNTMRGMIFCEGPALLGLSYVWLPDAGIPVGAFIVITLLLFVEELCLWFDVFGGLKNCCKEYNKRRVQALENQLPIDVNKKFYHIGEQKTVEHAVAMPSLSDDDDNSNLGSIVNRTNTIVTATSTCSDANTRVRSTKSSNDSKRSGH